MRQCSSVHAVHKIAVMVNAMNASVSDPAFISSLVQLHNCGLDELQLQGNDLTGSITNDYKQLAGLTVLDLCKQSRQQLTACMAGAGARAGAGLRQ